MIKFKDGQLTDILPIAMKQDIETHCISYALQQQVKKIVQLADRTRTVAVIEELPEKILDVLAVELRTPYYQESMDIETKRSIIKRTLLWHTKAGTPSAVSELIEIVFGEGNIVEWFDYDEPPYTPGTFDIITNAQMTEEITEYFLSIIQRVKNTRSHIRRILIHREMNALWYAGAASKSEPKNPVLNHTNMEQAVSESRYGAAGFVISQRTVIPNHLQFEDVRTEGIRSVAAGVAGHTIITIENNVKPRAVKAQGGTYGAAGHNARQRTVIINDGSSMRASISGTHTAAAAGHSSPKASITNGLSESTSAGQTQNAAIGVASHSKTII